MVKSIKVILSLLAFTLIVSCFMSAKTYAASSHDDNVSAILPPNTYYFEANGVMSSSYSDRQLFDQILKDKQSSVIADMKKMAADQFTDKSLSGGIETNAGIDLWSYDLSNLQRRKESMIVTIHRGSTPYRIFIPRGLKEVPIPNDPEGRTMWVEINREVIQASQAALNRYIYMVKEGIVIGSIASSFNIYSMYPEEQVPLTDILEDAKDANGLDLGYSKLKPTSVTINYSLDGFYNPLFGKMDVAQILKDGFNWSDKGREIQLTSTGSGDKILVGISDAFLDFMRPDSPLRETMFPDVDSNILARTNGVKSVKASISGISADAKNMVDAGMRLIVPSTFSKNDLKEYKIVEGEKGYKLIQGIRMKISENVVYKTDETSGKNEKLGAYGLFGIDLDSLVLGSTLTPDGRKVGAVIPLWYKELVVSTTPSDGGKLYFTGRTIKIGNDYSNRLTLDGKNIDLFAVDTKSSGKQAIDVRKYAFTETADHLKREDHISVGQAPDFFRLKLIFNTKDGEAKGFSIIRNNYYLDDQALTTWLQTMEAKAMTEVEADKLYKLINGGLEVSSTTLSYDQWNRLQEIRTELEASDETSYRSIIRVVIAVFGDLLVIYSILLVLSYWIDILNLFNSLVDIPFLQMLTFGRLYPVESKDDLNYLSGSRGNVSYVTFLNVLVRAFVGLVVGLLFIFGVRVIEFLLWLYYKMSSLIGGF